MTSQLRIPYPPASSRNGEKEQGAANDGLPLCLHHFAAYTVAYSSSQFRCAMVKKGHSLEYQNSPIGQAYVSHVETLTEGEQVTVVLSVVEGAEFDRDCVPR